MKYGNMRLRLGFPKLPAFIEDMFFIAAGSSFNMQRCLEPSDIPPALSLPCWALGRRLHGLQWSCATQDGRDDFLVPGGQKDNIYFSLTCNCSQPGGGSHGWGAGGKLGGGGRGWDRI